MSHSITSTFIGDERSIDRNGKHGSLQGPYIFMAQTLDEQRLKAFSNKDLETVSKQFELLKYQLRNKFNHDRNIHETQIMKSWMLVSEKEEEAYMCRIREKSVDEVHRVHYRLIEMERTMERVCQTIAPTFEKFNAFNEIKMAQKEAESKIKSIRKFNVRTKLNQDYSEKIAQLEKSVNFLERTNERRNRSQFRTPVIEEAEKLNSHPTVPGSSTSPSVSRTPTTTTGRVNTISNHRPSWVTPPSTPTNASSNTPNNPKSVTPLSMKKKEDAPSPLPTFGDGTPLKSAEKPKETTLKPTRSSSPNNFRLRRTMSESAAGAFNTEDIQPTASTNTLPRKASFSASEAFEFETVYTDDSTSSSNNNTEKNKTNETSMTTSTTTETMTTSNNAKKISPVVSKEELYNNNPSTMNKSESTTTLITTSTSNPLNNNSKPSSSNDMLFANPMLEQPGNKESTMEKKFPSADNLANATSTTTTTTTLDGKTTSTEKLTGDASSSSTTTDEKDKEVHAVANNIISKMEVKSNPLANTRRSSVTSPVSSLNDSAGAAGDRNSNGKLIPIQEIPPSSTSNNPSIAPIAVTPTRPFPTSGPIGSPSNVTKYPLPTGSMNNNRDDFDGIVPLPTFDSSGKASGNTRDNSLGSGVDSSINGSVIGSSLGDDSSMATDSTPGTKKRRPTMKGLVKRVNSLFVTPTKVDDSIKQEANSNFQRPPKPSTSNAVVDSSWNSKEPATVTTTPKSSNASHGDDFDFITHIQDDQSMSSFDNKSSDSGSAPGEPSIVLDQPQGPVGNNIASNVKPTTPSKKFSIYGLMKSASLFSKKKGDGFASVDDSSSVNASNNGSTPSVAASQTFPTSPTSPMVPRGSISHNNTTGGGGGIAASNDFDDIAHIPSGEYKSPSTDYQQQRDDNSDKLTPLSGVSIQPKKQQDDEISVLSEQESHIGELGELPTRKSFSATKFIRKSISRMGSMNRIL